MLELTGSFWVSGSWIAQWVRACVWCVVVCCRAIHGCIYSGRQSTDYVGASAGVKQEDGHTHTGFLFFFLCTSTRTSTSYASVIISTPNCVRVTRVSFAFAACLYRQEAVQGIH